MTMFRKLGFISTEVKIATVMLHCLWPVCFKSSSNLFACLCAKYGGIFGGNVVHCRG